MVWQESSKKASIICPESEIEALGGWDGATPEQLSAKLERLNQRLQHENQQYGTYTEKMILLLMVSTSVRIYSLINIFHFSCDVDFRNLLMILG